MPQKSLNQDFKEKYSYVHVGTLVSICVKDIFSKNCCFLFSWDSVLEYEKNTLHEI